MELPDDINKKAKIDFVDNASKAIHHLKAFQNNQSGPLYRILRSAINLAKGDIKTLKFELKNANIDWRDVICYGEKKSFECDEPFKFID
ncbi:hypothetical protein [Croceitalea vernalis]|uniref:Uncharacterized protein n=1 Tax=Croceitalea vernalis TaxID=3075599 RepID=A0ABU3BF84_9FLAO|nr:hypothetical protein [Croceitalea sp. P007]MDT0620819.1 hypothetical protein [Croceitalea sp. P007]